MFTLLESIADLELASLADGLDDGEPQAIGSSLVLMTTVEAVKEALTIERRPLTGVGDAQCPLLYIYISMLA